MRRETLVDRTGGGIRRHVHANWGALDVADETGALVADGAYSYSVLDTEDARARDVADNTLTKVPERLGMAYANRPVGNNGPGSIGSELLERPRVTVRDSRSSD